jgi:hypothetical protein
MRPTIDTYRSEDRRYETTLQTSGYGDVSVLSKGRLVSDRLPVFGVVHTAANACAIELHRTRRSAT